MNSNFAIPLFSLMLSILIIPIVRKCAVYWHIVDKPNARKVHHNPIPIAGGISIFISAWLVIFLILGMDEIVAVAHQVFIPSLILLIVGFIDDLYDIRATYRLAIQVILSHYLFQSGINITSLHGFFGIYDLNFWQQYFLTVIIITGIINAFNLIDGIDGLAGSISLISFAVISYISMVGHSDTTFVICLGYMGSIIGFLRYNFSIKKKIFLGDAGSMMLGLVVAILSIDVLPQSIRLSEKSWILIAVVSILLIPVMDALRVFKKRITLGLSPFHSDKSHIHHLVLYLGISHKAASFFIVVMSVLCMGVGFLVNNWVGVTIAIFSMLAIFYLIIVILEFHHSMVKWKEKIKQIETLDKD